MIIEFIFANPRNIGKGHPTIRYSDQLLFQSFRDLLYRSINSFIRYILIYSYEVYTVYSSLWFIYIYSSMVHLDPIVL